MRLRLPWGVWGAEPPRYAGGSGGAQPPQFVELSIRRPRGSEFRVRHEGAARFISGNLVKLPYGSFRRKRNRQKRVCLTKFMQELGTYLPSLRLYV